MKNVQDLKDFNFYKQKDIHQTNEEIIEVCLMNTVPLSGLLERGIKKNSTYWLFLVWVSWYPQDLSPTHESVLHNKVMYNFLPTHKPTLRS